jgi:hypothetical protein
VAYDKYIENEELEKKVIKALLQRVKKDTDSTIKKKLKGMLDQFDARHHHLVSLHLPHQVVQPLAQTNARQAFSNITNVATVGV